MSNAITFHRNKLLNAVSVAARMCDNRSPHDARKCILLSVMSDMASVVGVDADSMAIELRIDANSPVNVRSMIKPDVLLSVLRSGTTDTVDISIDADAWRITWPGADFRLSCGDPAEFPPLPTMGDDNTTTVTLPGLSMGNLFRRTIKATDPDAGRNALDSVRLTLQNGQIEAAATDSRRLHVATEFWPKIQLSETASAIVPLPAAKLVIALTGDAMADVQLAISEKSVRFAGDDWTLWTQQSAGRFPDYRKVLPADKSIRSRLSLPLDVASTAFGQAKVCTSQESVGVDLNAGPDGMQLKSLAAAIGSGDIRVPVEVEGECSLTINPAYVLDFLSGCPAESSILLSMIDAENPLLMTALSGRYQMVLMPLSRDR